MKLWMNRVLDFVLWISICVMLATGLMIRYRLPPGSRGGAGLSIWDWSRHDWGDLHTWSAYTLCVMVVLHLVLHARWLWTSAFPRFKWPVVAGLLAGLVLVVSAWLLPVEQGGDEHHSGAGQGQGMGRNQRP